MKAVARRRETATIESLAGRVLCHDVRDASGRIAVGKGRRLDPEAARAVLAASWDELHLIEVDADDLHEEEAGRRLAAAVVGGGVSVRGYGGGQWTLAATRRGLLRVRLDALADVNALDGVSVFTLFDAQPVEAGETVGKAKVTPLVIDRGTIETAESRARAADGLLAVGAFHPLTIGVVARETLGVAQRARFETALAQKTAWFGSRLLPVRYAAGSAAAVGRELRALRADGARIFVVAGASALDPLDPVFGALTLVGARMERHGAPAHPGSLLWIADWEGAAILGMPTCGMFSEATTFDLVLPRILAGERVGNREVATLGHGGLLSRDSAYRFPPYRANVTRGALE